MFFSQHDFEIRCEWGITSVNHLLAESDVIVVVDVLSFSTCVDIAVGNGAEVYPYAYQDESATIYAQSVGALLASSRRDGTGYSLSPSSLRHIPANTRLVLPSPNGSTISLATQNIPTIAGCLRNAEAVATVLPGFGSHISLIPAGERWPDGSLRVALEDFIGAGAIIHYLKGTRSPEAQAAEVTFLHFQNSLASCIRQIGSGKELIERGFSDDVDLAVGFNESSCVPLLKNGAYSRL